MDGVIEQQTITMRGRDFSWIDFGGPGQPVVALHGTFGRAIQFGELAQRLAPDYRIIALDQRGHGLSEHGGTFTRTDFVADAAEFIERLALAPALIIGHSLGGVNALQLAAWHPHLVHALVLEDTPVVTDETELPHPVVDTSGWPLPAATRQELAESFAAMNMPAIGYFLDSVVEQDDRWTMCFDYADMMAAQHGNVGRWWDDWLGSTHPATLLHGTLSPLLSARLATDMVARRPGTELVEFPGCGHWIHRDDPAGYSHAIRTFLDRQGVSGGRGADLDTSPSRRT
nr:putative hydrolase (alpha/beta fold family) [Kibdelosporangium sp. MJ126-NF4]CTQ90852.1 putative hydrolase (alpha/beta fold family) [Kibdelosporangium sp. MJ126-NF4]